jgi:nitrogen-specific signal transduction histidine kinase
MNEPLQHLNGNNGHAPTNGAPEAESGTDLQLALRRVTHDINNPLSIISGNAQLLIELSKVLDLDPDVAKPIRDIEEASQRLANMVERLNALNDVVRQNGYVGDGM